MVLCTYTFYLDIHTETVTFYSENEVLCEHLEKLHPAISRII